MGKNTGRHLSAKSKIEWTDATWNPIRGCSRVSEGCRHCYAERVAARFSGAGQPYEGLAVMKSDGPHWTGEVRLVEEHLSDPLRWRKPRRIFVNSMSDLFHEQVPDEWIDRIFAVMAVTPGHSFQVLTKRPERMRAYCASNETKKRLISEIIRLTEGLRGCSLAIPGDNGDGLDGMSLPNVWLGVSVENQPTADERIPLLLQTPAAVRWVSYEPALGPVDFKKMAFGRVHKNGGWKASRHNLLQPITIFYDEGDVNLPGLDWLVCGGESGPGARPMHPDWARRARDQCVAAGVPFFFKQWGEWQPICALYGDPERDDKENGCGELFSLSLSGEIVEDRQPPNGSWLIERVGKKTAGRLLDGREWNEYPQIVTA